MLDKIKALPEEERLKRVNIIKEVVGIILYFVMLNNPGKAGLIKLAMRIFGITEEKFTELDGIKNLGAVPYDKAVLDAVMQGDSIFDVDRDSPAITAVRQILNENLGLEN